MIAEGGVFDLSSIYINYNTFSYHQISRIILKKDKLENQNDKLLIFHTKIAPINLKKFIKLRFLYSNFKYQLITQIRFLYLFKFRFDISFFQKWLF